MAWKRKQDSDYSILYPWIHRREISESGMSAGGAIKSMPGAIRPVRT